MRPDVLLVLGSLAAALPGVASAESLRCDNGIVAEGDSRLALAYKCGAPLAVDSYCPPVFYVGSPYLVPEPIAGIAVPCVATEEWLYQRGAGNLLATVRLRGGRIQSITYGRSPQ
ncbi:MAG TPA: DUF2845 domain-containing protein [Caldimonas sp.]|jgi:hypothetical protein|nr:DUF2845 domain-containing protein [Caldimonas sp.]HEX4233377.1 DUF2845 domain-containing protein [Caldimonas sp.]